MIRLFNPFLASVALHLAVFAVISSLVLLPVRPKVEAFSVVEVAPWTSEAPSKGGKPSPRRSHALGPSLSDLGLGWKGTGNASIPSDTHSIVEGKEVEDGVGLQRSATASLYRTRKAVLYDRLEERIDAALSYPKELGEAGIEGTVNARFVFDESGRWIESRSTLSATSRYLKVYIAQLARRCFQEPIARTYLQGRDSFELRCLFIFSLTGEGFMGIGPSGAGTKATASVSGKLTFFRAAKAFGAWDVGPFHGYGVAPAVGVDPNWVLDKVEEAVSRPKAQEDPLEKYRRDSAW